VRKPKGIGRPRHRWVDNIKMDLGELGWGGVNVVMNLQVP
jgi:hypothetical protein